MIHQLEATSHSEALPELQDIKEIFSKKTNAEIEAIGDKVIKALRRKKLLAFQERQRKRVTTIHLELEPANANLFVEPLLKNKQHVAVSKHEY